MTIIHAVPELKLADCAMFFSYLSSILVNIIAQEEKKSREPVRRAA